MEIVGDFRRDSRGSEDDGRDVLAAVGKLLVALGYSRQVNRKTREGSRYPGCGAQQGP